ncbi:unnamed protein product [Calicophoron daubneyi]|uniref:Metallo-beta-lactamase domain-containing protein n=1 Tax=Calicophoron daubneyi TaxID=300641 RepID=A0AAV2T0S2_CALDB
MEKGQYSVFLLREGSYSRSPEGVSRRKCNTVLVRGPAGSIIVNPGSVWDGPNLLSSLKSLGVTQPEKEIDYVVCTDGRAEHVGCLSLFPNANMMIVGYDIQKPEDVFLEHDFGDGSVPYEFDEQCYVVGTPGLRTQQVTLLVTGRLITDNGDVPEKVGRIAITGGLFTDEADASCVSLLDHPERKIGDCINDKENFMNSWRRSRQYVLDRADWIIPAYGQAFEVRAEYSSTPCVELA